MSATRRVAVIEDPVFREHRSPRGHPECPERLEAVGRAIAARASRLRPGRVREASDEEILRVHPRTHLQSLAAAVARAPAHLDPDTYVSPRSLEVARLAAGTAVEAALAVARGEAHAVFAALRPPGHHAEADRAMGFCLLNNVAIAARALQAEAGLERIAIIDWDVHHGNGTQHIFESDPTVLYLSTHQFPFYPGTGAAGEVGLGRGAGATVNIPLPAGSGDREYRGVFQNVVVPVLERFSPEFVLVSCGFDAHRDDPLASMRLGAEGFASMARVVRALAERSSAGRLVLLLEGGYSPVGLEEGTGAVLDQLLAEGSPELAPPAPLDPESSLARILHPVLSAQKPFHPELAIR